MDCLIHERVPVLADVDVLVIGGGSAGCCAALAARETRRHSVMLVERYGFAGGTSTQVLDTFYGFFTPGDEPKKVVGGLPDRIVGDLDAAGRMFLRPNTYGAGTGVTYDPEFLKVVWDRRLLGAGVRVMYHSILVGVEGGSAGPVAAVFRGRGCFFRVRARRFIDASGDADFCYHAGIAYERAGDLAPAQTLTTTFRMCGVDLDRFEAAGGKGLLMRLMDEAVETGSHPLPRKAGSAHAMVQRGCVATVAVRVADLDPMDSEALTRAEIEGRSQAYVYEAFLRDRVPGYEGAMIVGLSHQIGVRETRRVYGEYRLTRQDCLGAAAFDDAVLLCGAPIEDHRPQSGGREETAWAYVPGGGAYGVPYRTLVPRGQDVVWVAGRCFSATHDAHASCRSMGQTMSMGQAAGLAAGLSLETDRGARELCADALRRRLIGVGAVLEMPGRVADTAADGWRRNVAEGPL